MDGLKRSHDLQKVRYNGKIKECSKPASSRHKLYDSTVPDGESSLANLPIVKQADNAKLLPRYTAVLGRNVDDGVSRDANDGVKMEDLDQLQQDLEKLLSTSAVRHRLLKAEIENIDQKEERRENKKGKPVDKPPLKRKKIDERVKYRDAKNGIRLLKPKHYNVPLHSNIDIQHKEEIPKVTIPKNDTSDKFWLSIEPYCADVTKDDLVFIDELIKECSQEIEVKIPEIGDHYTLDWLEEMINQEQSLGSGTRNTKNKTLTLNHELKKNGLNAMVETFSSPFTQRLLAALIEEKVITKLPTPNDKNKVVQDTSSSINSNNKSPNVPGACLESNNKIKREEKDFFKLHYQNLSTEDDILQEIKKCQQELETVNAHNVTELKKLKAIVEKDLKRQEVKAELDHVDSQVLEMYNRILMAKQKQLAANEEESFDKTLYHKHYTKEFENEANNIIKKQVSLIRELTELSNNTHLY
ncbi:transcriptional adapter 3-A isoform X2 [Agrilus planipennis]|uniref:Transcriptional adapter 3-A isoform X2 n=1 Tax=Agrilus planipennis TaxID=224129 RepID=A0A1W4XIU1_AGRPL|nr:transcriptional adapter 3-A isoform X2 [Agrilus planipennis]